MDKVAKPVRYMGNEYNMVIKDPSMVNIRFVFAFPDVYEVGMSHLGIKILYHLLNERQDTYCERVFAPWIDMEEQMRKNDVSLFSLETKENIRSFDILGFTLQYEMSYTNILNMLDLSKIPIQSCDRTNDDPFIIAGGPCAFNPEPLAQFIDFFVIGESEEILPRILDIYKLWKVKEEPRENFLLQVSNIPGIYVPSYFDVSYFDDGRLSSLLSKKDNLPAKVDKQVVENLNQSYFPETLIVPYMDIVHDRIILEIFRGCTRGCRFCQAGMIYRPVRERSVERLLDLAEKIIAKTGYEEMSLSSLSTGDYGCLDELVTELMKRFEKKKVSLSLPSLRIDSFAKEYIEEVQKVRKTGLTFAPEAGTQRLRDVINKKVTEENLISSVHDAFSLGWTSVKLYFMIGLPTESEEDLKGIASMTKHVVDAYHNIPKEVRQKGLRVTVSTSSFVPKPFTPFQWESQISIEEMRTRQRYLQNILHIKGVEYNWHEPELSYMEAIFSRGDRRLGNVLYSAWKLGCKFDGWSDQFKYDMWIKAFQENKIDPGFYANRKREQDELLPWDHINPGVTREFLWNEYEASLAGQTTIDCRNECINCGVSSLLRGGCR